MCGRFSQSEDSWRIAERFAAALDPDALTDEATGSWNVAPTDPIRMVVQRDARRLLTPAEWGFRPFWRARPGWINAKAETAWESRAFAPALRAQRCLIPADAFYEWDRSRRPPQPYAIGPADDAGVLALAGIFTEADGADPPTAAILTTAPNAVVARLHHRMPVMLPAGSWDVWLDPATDVAEVAALLIAPLPGEALRLWPVSSSVNKVGNDGPELLRPVGESAGEAAPTLGL